MNNFNKGDINLGYDDRNGNPMIADIKEFHEKFRLEYNGLPRELPGRLFDFRMGFMHEELTEYANAFDQADKTKQLDALVDLVYVALGTAYLHGFDFNEAWRRVHAANMLKVRALNPTDSVRGSTYDVVKPKNWQPPNLEDLV